MTTAISRNFGGIDQADAVQDTRLVAEDHGRRHVTLGVGRDDHRDVERDAEDAVTPLGDDGRGPGTRPTIGRRAGTARRR